MEINEKSSLSSDYSDEIDQLNVKVNKQVKAQFKDYCKKEKLVVNKVFESFMTEVIEGRIRIVKEITFHQTDEK